MYARKRKYSRWLSFLAFINESTVWGTINPNVLFVQLFADVERMLAAVFLFRRWRTTGLNDIEGARPRVNVWRSLVAQCGDSRLRTVGTILRRGIDRQPSQCEATPTALVQRRFSGCHGVPYMTDSTDRFRRVGSILQVYERSGGDGEVYPKLKERTGRYRTGRATSERVGERLFYMQPLTLFATILLYVSYICL